MDQSALFLQKLQALESIQLEDGTVYKVGKTITTASFSEEYDFINIISRAQLQIGVPLNTWLHKIALPNAWLGDNLCEDCF